MGLSPKRLQASYAAVSRLAEGQHGVVARAQLLELGLNSDAIRHRIETRRLHPLWRGVYALGRPQVDQHGRWMAATLACGPEAMLSHRSGAALLGLLSDVQSEIDIVVPSRVVRRRPGIRIHRRAGVRAAHRRAHFGIPVTDPVSILIDLAGCLSEKLLVRAINEADRLDLIDPKSLRAALEEHRGRRGVVRLRKTLDIPTIKRTDSELERRFLSLLHVAKLPLPETQAMVNGLRVDFFWPELGLVVETDGLRYHRTPSQQARDLRREQVHTAAGLTALRFPAAQVLHKPAEVETTLIAVVAELQRRCAKGFGR